MTPYILKSNFRKCPRCSSTKIYVRGSGFVRCRKCNTTFIRQVSETNPKDSSIVLLTNAGMVSLSSKESVTFT